MVRSASRKSERVRLSLCAGVLFSPGDAGVNPPDCNRRDSVEAVGDHGAGGIGGLPLFH
jgi:hypothetical protein